jgi:hypothetical protein
MNEYICRHCGQETISPFYHPSCAIERIALLEKELELAKDTRAIVDKALHERRVQVESQMERITQIEAEKRVLVDTYEAGLLADRERIEELREQVEKEKNLTRFYKEWALQIGDKIITQGVDELHKHIESLESLLREIVCNKLVRVYSSAIERQEDPPFDFLEWEAKVLTLIYQGKPKEQGK